MRPLRIAARLARAFTLLGFVSVGAGGLLSGACAKRAPSVERKAAKAAPGARGAPALEEHALALCRALHEVPSRRRAECCAEPVVTLYFDECVRLLSKAVAARTVSIERSKLGLCAERVAETTRGCDWIAPTYAAAPRECAGAVRGLVPEGGSCMSSVECEGALHCAGQGATSRGTCRKPQDLGAACGTGVDSLATYLLQGGFERQKPLCNDFCDFVTHRCAKKPHEGAPCRASVNCASDQACKSGRCARVEQPSLTRASQPGDACTTDFDCSAGGCIAGADGERRCAKKCSTDFASLAKRSPLGSLGLGKSPTRPGSTSRTSTRTESANP